MRFTNKEEAREWQHRVTSRVGEIIKDRMYVARIPVFQMAEDLCSNWGYAPTTAQGAISDYRGGYARSQLSRECRRITEDIDHDGIATKVTAYQPKDRTKVRDIFRYLHAKESSLAESAQVR